MARRRVERFVVESVDRPPWWALVSDRSGPVPEVVEYLLALTAGGASVLTIRMYAYDLLRWWRWLAVRRVRWDRASPVDVRDVVLWMQESRPAGAGLGPATINHCLAVLSSFYEHHVAAGRVVVSPVPSGDRGLSRRHRSPMELPRHRRRGPLCQKTPTRIPRGLTDDEYSALFNALVCDRDRALISLFASTGARAEELLGLTLDDVDWGRQLVDVRRKGTGATQSLAGSPDTFVWLRLYVQARDATELRGVWLTVTGAPRRLCYMAARRMLQRANTSIGTSWTFHDLRHMAARRMVADPALSLIDVQRVLGHAHLSTTQRYVEAIDAEVIERTIEHHRRPPRPKVAVPSPAYAAGTLDTLFGWTNNQTRGSK